MHMSLESIGLLIPDILLPSAQVDKHAWSVIACDQYSSDLLYWQEVEALSRGKASSLNMIFPEAYLQRRNPETIIDSIHAAMATYSDDGTLEEHKKVLTLCRRRCSDGRERKGVMVALDLEHYDYTAGAQTLIRATEGTIVERLPPRIKVRQQASIECPHIMVLIDDPEHSVIEPLFEEPAQTVYDFDLMQNGGHVNGSIISDENCHQRFAQALIALGKADFFQRKYGCSEDYKPLLFAMGDGNHSFATAKLIWETMKEQQGLAAVVNHPARYALVELVNLYDPSLEFEAIHRVLFNVKPTDFIQGFTKFSAEQGISVELADTENAQQDVHSIGMVFEGYSGWLNISKPKQQLAVGSLQLFIDHYLQNNPKTRVDYIHGEMATHTLGKNAGNMGFVLPAICKHSLFKTVIFDGALPRKTFSMGEANDKRFYLESRRLV